MLRCSLAADAFVNAVSANQSADEVRCSPFAEITNIPHVCMCSQLIRLLKLCFTSLMNAPKDAVVVCLVSAALDPLQLTAFLCRQV